MRLVFFNSCRTWGGGEKWHFEMASALHDIGHEILFFASEGSPLYNKIQDKGIDVHKIRVRSMSFINPIKRILVQRKLKEFNPDHIIINLSADLKLAGFSAKTAKVPSIIYRRGSAIPIKDRFLNRLIFAKVVTSIIANSEETKSTINALNNKLFPKDKIRVIYNGIQTENF